MKFAFLTTQSSDKDVVQLLGRSNRKITFMGFVKSGTDSSFLESLVGATGSIYADTPIGLIRYTSVGGTAPIVADFLTGDFDDNDFFTGTTGSSDFRGYIQVYYSKIDFKDSGNSPMIRDFSLETIQLF